MYREQAPQPNLIWRLPEGFQSGGITVPPTLLATADEVIE
jgi:hypothetical protein